MSAEHCRNTGCTGCPHCSYEMAAILEDASTGRFEALSHKMAAITNRTIRLLRGELGHPAARSLASETVPSPTHEGFIAKFRRRASTPLDRVREVLTEGRLPASQAPTPNLRPGANIPAGAPPDLNAIIRARKEKS